MWKWGALMPHAPIIVPEVGGTRNRECLSSVRAMQMTGERTRPYVPSFLLVLNPHAPFGGGCTVLYAREYSGSLADFGAANVSVKTEGAGEEGRRLVEMLASDFPVEWVERDRIKLDYGAIVPLSFLARTWGWLPPVLIMNPVGLGYEEAWEFGKALSRFESENSWALIASGDLSHRLSPGAPGGYHPDGEKLDSAICEALQKVSPVPLFDLGERVIYNGGECGLRSALVLIGLVTEGSIDLLSYEGPFGVGYGVALWINPKARAENESTLQKMKQQDSGSARDDGKPYTSLARRVLEKYLETGQMPDVNTLLRDEKIKLLKERKACFVSLKERDGTLRGCIGTIEPVYENLAREIAENAVAAATRDPRFPPVSRKELDNLVLSVDILSQPEPVTSISQLDPSRYGVIGSKGAQRGVLLPDLPGVNTVEEQLSIAMRKAGIISTEHLSVSRFTVSRHVERREG